MDDTTRRRRRTSQLTQLQQQLAAAEMQRDDFAHMLAHIADGVTVQDATGRLIYANDTAGQICGYASGAALVAAPPGEVLQHFAPFDEAGAPFPWTRLPGRLALQGDPQPPDAIVQVHGQTTGEERWSLIKARPVFDPAGHVRMVINVWHDITALKQAEASFRDQSDSVAVTLASIGDAVIVTDVAGRVTFLNPVAEHLTGWPRQDAQGQLLEHVFQIVNEATRALVESPVTQVLREGTIVGLANHTILLARDGREIPIDDSGAPIHAADGVLRGVVLVFRDVTERKREEQLQQFRLEAITLLTASLDVNTTLVTVAQLAVPRLGDWCAVDMLDEHGALQRLAVVHRDPTRVAWAHEIHQRYPPDLTAEQGIALVLRTGETLFMPQITDAMLVAAARDEAQLALMRAIGFTSAMVVPLLARGHVFGAISFIAAESGHRYTEADRQIAEELARRASIALDNARLYAAAQAARQAAEQVSDRLRRMQTVTAALSEALTRQQVAEVIVAQGCAALDAHAGMVNALAVDGTALTIVAAVGYAVGFLAALQEVPLARELPITVAARTGTALWIRSTEEYQARFPAAARALQPITGTQALASLPLIVEQRVLGVLSFAFLHPRSFDEPEQAFIGALALQCAQALERARLYDEAQQAIRVRDQFLALAAHELKTPMTTILASGQLLQRHVEHDAHASDRDRQRARSMVDQTQRLNRLITALLDLSRLQEGRLTLAPLVLDLRELVQQVVEETRPTVPQHALRLQVPAEPCWMTGDRLRLAQVCQHLLQNAVKYSPEGGAIEVALAPDADHMCLSVTDHGMGMLPEDLPLIFERFYRGKEIATDQLSGMGIGLYVVKEIVSLHGGTVMVDSRPGQGSRFEVRLPRLIV